MVNSSKFKLHRKSLRRHYCSNKKRPCASHLRPFAKMKSRKRISEHREGKAWTHIGSGKNTDQKIQNLQHQLRKETDDMMKAYKNYENNSSSKNQHGDNFAKPRYRDAELNNEVIQKMQKLEKDYSDSLANKQVIITKKPPSYTDTFRAFLSKIQRK